MDGLTFFEHCTLLYWYLLDNWAYTQYLFYVNDMGLLPKYAVEKVKSLTN